MQKSKGFKMFDFQYKKQKETIIVKLTGYLELYNLEKIRDFVESKLIHEKNIIFECKNLVLLDSAGLGLIFKLIEQEEKKKTKKIIFVSLNSQIKKMFNDTKLYDYFEYFDSIKSAKEEINKK